MKIQISPKTAQYLYVAAVLLVPAIRAAEVGPPIGWHRDGAHYEPKFSLDTSYKPIKDWRIFKGKEGVDYTVTSGSSGGKFNIYFLDFDKADFKAKTGISLQDKPIILGWEVEHWDNGAVAGATKGIARTRTQRVNGRGVATRLRREFKSGKAPVHINIEGDFYTLDSLAKFSVNANSPDIQFIASPTIAAESDGKFLVINSYDLAGMTVGVAQMAAHDHKDLLKMIKQMGASDLLKQDSWASMDKWYPEIGLSHGKLVYNHGGMNGGLEGGLKNSWNAAYAWKEMPEDFIRFCNPEVQTDKAIDDQELQFIARWLIWSLSEKMQQAQIEAVSEQFLDKISRLAGDKKVTGEDIACAAVLYHWLDGKSMQDALKEMLKQPDPAKVFFSLAGQDYPSYFSFLGESSRERVRVRVKAVRDLYNKEPAIPARLRAIQCKDGKILAS